MFIDYKNKCNESNIHTQNKSSQQMWPQFFLTVLSSSCCHLRVLLFISKNVLWPFRPWKRKKKKIIISLVCCGMKSSRLWDGRKWCVVSRRCEQAAPRCLTVCTSRFRSSCEQQSVHEDPAAAQHPEEAQETATQRVLHRRLGGDRRGYSPAQNQHMRYILFHRIGTKTR